MYVCVSKVSSVFYVKCFPQNIFIPTSGFDIS